MKIKDCWLDWEDGGEMLKGRGGEVGTTEKKFEANAIK